MSFLNKLALLMAAATPVVPAAFAKKKPRLIYDHTATLKSIDRSICLPYTALLYTTSEADRRQGAINAALPRTQRSRNKRGPDNAVIRRSRPVHKNRGSALSAVSIRACSRRHSVIAV